MRITLFVGVLMMHAMGCYPEDRSAFQRQRAAHRQNIFHPLGSLITAMSKQPMISHAYANATGNPPQDHGDQERLPGEHKQSCDSAKVKRNHNEGSHPNNRLLKCPVVLEDLRHSHI